MLEGGAKIPKVDRSISHEKELGQPELALAEHPEGRLHRLAAIALAHDRGGEGMVAGLAVGPQVLDRRHDHGEQRREQLLEQVADVKVLLTRLSHDRRRYDRVASAAQRFNLEHRIIVAQRVASIVVAERSLGPTHTGRDRADQGQLGLRDQRVGSWPRAPTQAPTHQERGEQQLGDVLRERRDGRQD